MKLYTSFSLCIIWIIFKCASSQSDKMTSVTHAGSLLQNVLSSCYLHVSAKPLNQLLPVLQYCLRNETLSVLDKMHQSEILELSDGIQFVDNKMRNDFNRTFARYIVLL